jgi:hypothetical protein
VCLVVMGVEVSKAGQGSEMADAPGLRPSADTVEANQSEKGTFAYHNWVRTTSVWLLLCASLHT